MAFGPGTQTPADFAIFDLKLGDYVEIARRRSWWILLSMLALFIASAVVAYRLPNIYRAETMILVDSSQVPYSYVTPIVTSDIAARLTTLQQQVLSPTRLKKLIEAEGLYPSLGGKKTEDDVIHAVQNSIIIEVVNPGAGKMGAFRIAYSSKRRDEVARVANHLAEMFIEENLKAREEQSSGTAQFLEDQLTETKRQLDATDAQLRTIKSRNILDLPESKPYHLEALATLRGRVQTIQDKISQDQRDKSMLQSMLLSGGPAPTVNLDGDAGGGLSSDEAQIQKLEARLSELRTRYGPEHPEVRRTGNEIDRLKKKMANSPHDSAASALNQQPAIQPDKSSPRNPVLQTEIEKLDEDIKEQSKLLPPLQQQMEFHTSKLAEEPVFEQKISRLQQDYESLRREYTSLLEKKQAAEMSYALEVHQKAERFVVLDTAQTPLKPSSPNRLLVNFAGLMGGLLLGVGLALGVEMNDETVRSEDEATRILGKPVLTGIPRLVSAQERKVLWLRGTGMVVCTVIGSLAVGMLVSFVAGRLL